MVNVAKIIEELDLKPHPEGGYYRENYRHPLRLDSVNGNRNLATSIYYLLHDSQLSKFHRLTSDEIWYHHSGDSAIIHCFFQDSGYRKIRLGAVENSGSYQVVLPAGTIFGAEVENNHGYFLAGCMVSPGFDFNDFEFVTREELLAVYPENRNLIHKFT